MTTQRPEIPIRSPRSFPIKAILFTFLLTVLGGSGLLFTLNSLGQLTTVLPFLTSSSGSCEQGGAVTGDGEDHQHGHEAAAGDSAKKQLWTCGMHPMIITEEPGLCPICNMDLTPKRDDDALEEEKGERMILYYRAPMNPQEIYDAPGQSKMGMALVPVYEDEVMGGVEIKVDPVTQQNMGVRTARVKKGVLRHTIRTYGHITYNETRTAQVSPKVNGWFEKLYVDFTGEHVKAGQPLFELYSPDLLAAQEEYLSALRSRHSQGGGDRLLASARNRLRYFDIAESEIERLRAAGKVSKSMLIRSPFTGVVTHKNAVQGAFVKAGTTVYKLADLGKLWVEAHIYEYELDWVEEGQAVEMQLPYYPGKVYEGKVAYIYPYMQPKTRDVVIRLEFDNPDLALKPDMYADVHIKTLGKGEGLIIPDEAVIRSGARNVVIVAKGNGKFTPRNVTMGMALDEGEMQILSGLARGEVVVTSGQFLLDSESKLKEAVKKMMEARNQADDPAPVNAEDGRDDDFFADFEGDSTGSDDFFSDLE